MKKIIPAPEIKVPRSDLQRAFGYYGQYDNHGINWPIEREDAVRVTGILLWRTYPYILDFVI